MSDATTIHGACHCGALTWACDGVPADATICNCTVCHRYGVLWAYDYDGEGIRVAGPTTAYRSGDGDIGFHFCPTCGGLGYWRASHPDRDGRRRIAINLRLAVDPAEVAAIPLRRHDGLNDHTDLPRDGRTVGNVVF